jgi:hypothetical protein
MPGAADEITLTPFEALARRVEDLEWHIRELRMELLRQERRALDRQISILASACASPGERIAARFFTGREWSESQPS